MELLAVIVGVGICSGILLAFGFIQPKQHAVLKILAYCFAIFLLWLIPHHLLNNSACVGMTNATTVAGTTSYSFYANCGSASDASLISFSKVITYFVVILITYMIFWILYDLVKRLYNLMFNKNQGGNDPV